MKSPSFSSRRPWPWSALLCWFIVYSLLWVLLSTGDGLYFGLVVAALAALVSISLRLPVWRIKLTGLPGFAVFFVRELFIGAWDVAGRILAPRVGLAHTGWRHYPFLCEHPRVRFLTAALIGLLPGTLVSQVEGDRMHLHLLDTEQDWQVTVRRLEQKIGLLLGVDVPMDSERTG